MKPPGDADLPVRTRAALLDALQALEDQLDALVVIGAQALYAHAGKVEVAIPPETKDADIGIDGHRLQDDPALGRFLRDPFSGAVTEQALVYLADLFAAGAEAVGSAMAGRAEEGVGEPAVVAASVTALAGDLLDSVKGLRHA